MAGSAPSPWEETLRCPTCGAEQPWQETCRRCRSDLMLLCHVAAACRAARRRALAHLRAGRSSEALAEAHRAYTLSPDAPATRLLAVCHLVAGNAVEALTMAAVEPRGE